MKLSQTTVMALAGGLIAGVSYIAGRKEGIEIGKTKTNHVSEQIGYLRALNDIVNSVTKK